MTEPDPKTQTGLVLAYLRRHGSITPQEAIQSCGNCYRLGARVWELRHAGFEIENVWEEHGGEHPGRHAKYVLRGDAVQMELSA